MELWSSGRSLSFWLYLLKLILCVMKFYFIALWWLVSHYTPSVLIPVWWTFYIGNIQRCFFLLHSARDIFNLKSNIALVETLIQNFIRIPTKWKKVFIWTVNLQMTYWQACQLCHHSWPHPDLPVHLMTSAGIIWQLVRGKALAHGHN